jgi:hypothetical protein
MAASSKLPPLRHAMKGGMSLERTHVGRKQAEADCAMSVAVVDAVDQRREFLAPVVVGREQVRLVLDGGHQVEQHDADAERLISRDPAPELVETREQKAGVSCLVKIGFIPRAAEIADSGKMDA